MPIRVKRVAPDGTMSYVVILLTETYFLETASKQLISVKQAKAHGFKASFDDDGPEGFVDRNGNRYLFVTGSLGLSYLPV